MMKKKLSRTARKRRAVVFAVELVITLAALMVMVLIVGLIVHAATPALSGALMQAAEAVIG